MSAIKVGVREFRERIASFLESDTPVAVTRRGETLGVYVPTRRKHPKTADLSELKAAADRLAKRPWQMLTRSSWWPSSSSCAGAAKPTS